MLFFAIYKYDITRQQQVWHCFRPTITTQLFHQQTKRIHYYYYYYYVIQQPTSTTITTNHVKTH